MKNIRPLFVAIVTICLINLFPGKAHSQCIGGKTPLNEIGVRLGSITDASHVGGANIPGENLHTGTLNGIHYKRYSAVGAFRMSLGLTRFDYEDRRNCPNCLRTDGKVNGMKFRIGYEWFTFLGPVEPFFALNAILSYGTYKAESWSLGGAVYEETITNRERRGVGIGPTAGLRVYLGYAISISAETSVEAMMYGRKTTISRITPEASTVSRQNNYFDTTFQPLNWLSLNVLF
ncbi:MAG TPA: hypothetical protein ENJ82_05675 [Bacteroidetes bacterium]|nr:hypothetical protein [Bacteroidota bacterium]